MCEKNRCLLEAGCFTNLPRFQGARLDHVQVGVSGFCSPRPRELVSFGPRHMTHSPPIGKRI